MKLSESKKKLSEHSFSKHPYPSLISTTILTIYFNSSEREREREKKEKEKKKTIRSRTVHSHFTLSDHFCLFYFIFYYLFSERRSSFRQNSKIEKLELKCSSSDSNSIRNTCWKIRAWMVWEAEQQSITRVAHTSIRNIQQAH